MFGKQAPARLPVTLALMLLVVVVVVAVVVLLLVVVVVLLLVCQLPGHPCRKKCTRADARVSPH